MNIAHISISKQILDKTVLRVLTSYIYKWYKHLI